MATQRKFKAHEQHLVNTVLRQAGTLWKACLEAVMNSVDAGATKCEITLSEKKVIIQDDGRGFKTEKEIDAHFETFGTPHQEGDATYGEFRMGRGQMFAFGANDWKTGKFHMAVDVKKNGLDYVLDKLNPPVPGCRVEIDLYEPLLPGELLTAREELTKYVKYVSIPVSLNGEVLSVDPRKEKWNYDLDGAYLKLRENMNELRVYNQGVFVCGIPAGEVGSGGVLVSKGKLKLNFARNDVMRAGKEKCPIWAKVAPLMRKKIAETVARKPMLTGHARSSLLAQWLQGETPPNATRLQLFQATNGRWYSIEQLLDQRQKYPSVSAGDKFDMRADRAMQMRLGFVFARSTLEQADCETLQSFMKKLERLDAVRRFAACLPDSFRLGTWPIKTLEELDNSADTHYQILEDKDLQPVELAVLRTARMAAKRMLHCFEDVKPERRLVLGTSKNANGWTDGTTYVAINRDFLKRGAGGLDLWADLGSLLTHEYCHDGPTNATHLHTPEFYEAFHDAVRSGRYRGGAIANFVITAERLFAAELAKAKAKPNRRMVKRLNGAAGLKRATEKSGDALGVA